MTVFPKSEKYFATEDGHIWLFSGGSQENMSEKFSNLFSKDSRARNLIPLDISAKFNFTTKINEKIQNYVIIVSYIFDDKQNI